ncbi:hypothetical protein LUW77_03590 [Streptomyces radiopugnans]|nr:hypothetical protein LUW77_03590 [Streptomyces radiopugnans]
MTTPSLPNRGDVETVVKNASTYARDLAERIVATFLVAFLGVAVAVKPRRHVQRDLLGDRRRRGSGRRRLPREGPHRPRRRPEEQRQHRPGRVMACRAARRLQATLGRRGTFLAILGVGKTAYGVGFLFMPTAPPGLELLTGLCSLRTWAWLWIGAGLITISSAFLRVGRDWAWLHGGPHSPHRVGHRLHRRRARRRLLPRRCRRYLVPHLARRGHLVGRLGARAFGASTAAAGQERRTMTILGGLVAAFGTVGMVLAGLFAARATRAAAAATAEATQAAARAQAEPNQRAADLEAFREIRENLSQQITELSQQTSKLRLLVSAFASYVTDLTVHMRQAWRHPARAARAGQRVLPNWSVSRAACSCPRRPARPGPGRRPGDPGRTWSR